MNKLRDAYQRKIDRADKIEDRLREKSAKLGAKSATAKTKKSWERTQGKIGSKRETAYQKIKNIKSKVGTLGKRPEDFLKMVEDEKKIKQQDEQRQFKPTIPNFYGQ